MKITLFAAATVLTAGLAFGLAPAAAHEGAHEAASVDDAQIAAIVVTANQVDIDAGELAARTSKNPKVVEFAERMVTDHESVNAAAVALVTKLGVQPAENPTSTSLREGGDAHLAKLRSLSGAAFDAEYVAHEVAYHQQVIEALDGVLIPGAANAELKALLVQVRPAFTAHLEHARHLHAALVSPASQAGSR